MMADVPYEAWVDYVGSIWNRLGVCPKTVLDLACGTGSASVILGQRGFKVAGADLSPEMLAVARSKTAKAEFVVADMRTLNLKRKFDAVICLYDSLNYLLQESEISDAFRNVAKHLGRGGAFVFDVHTLPYITRVWASSDCFDLEAMHVCWRSRANAENGTNTVLLDCFVKNADSYDRFQETHTERGYPLEFLEAALKKAGFSVKGRWDAFTFNPPHERSERVYFAAVKR